MVFTNGLRHVGLHFQCCDLRAVSCACFVRGSMCNIRNAKSCGAKRWITKDIFRFRKKNTFTEQELALQVEYLICMCSNVVEHLEMLTT